MAGVKRAAVVGVIGGSGFYELLEGAREVHLDTPFGAPSDSYFLAEIGGVPVAFLPRHARGHRILPSEVNYRANIRGEPPRLCWRLHSLRGWSHGQINEVRQGSP